MPLTPSDALVAEMAERLDTNLREDFEERAGIIEFDALLPRAHAECLALLDVLWRHPYALTGLVAFRVRLEGETRYAITTDVNRARCDLSRVSGLVSTRINLSSAVKDQFCGMAFLTTI